MLHIDLVLTNRIPAIGLHSANRRLYNGHIKKGGAALKNIDLATFSCIGLVLCGHAGGNNGANIARTAVMHSRRQPTPRRGVYRLRSRFQRDPNPNWKNMQDEVSQEITKATGVTLRCRIRGRRSTKGRADRASGDYPDLITPKGDATNWLTPARCSTLTDLIDKYAPNHQEMFGDISIACVRATTMSDLSSCLRCRR